MQNKDIIIRGNHIDIISGTLSFSPNRIYLLPGHPEIFDLYDVHAFYFSSSVCYLDILSPIIEMFLDTMDKFIRLGIQI